MFSLFVSQARVTFFESYWATFDSEAVRGWKVVAALGVSCAVFHAWWYSRINRLRAKLPPGPEPLTPLQTLLSLWTSGLNSTPVPTRFAPELGLGAKALHEQYGESFTLWHGWVPVIVTRDPVAVKELLRQDGKSWQRSPEGLAAMQPFGTAVIANEGSYHLSRRKVLNEWWLGRQATSHKGSFDAMLGAVSEVLHKRFLPKIAKLAEAGATVDLRDLTQTCAFEVSVSFLFGASILEQVCGSDDRMTELRSAHETLNARTFPLLAVRTYWPKLAWWFGEWWNDLIFGGRGSAAVATSQLVPLTSLAEGKSKDRGEFAEWMANQLIASGSEQAEKTYWRDQSFDLLDAGIETTTAALVASLALLFSRANSTTLATVRSEIERMSLDASHGERSRIEASVQNLSKKQSPFLDAVVNEVMRLLSPVTALSPRIKMNSEHDEVSKLLGLKPNHGYVSVVVNLWGLHRNEKYWERPDEFVPERWEQSDADVNGTSLSAFMPFGAGPHGCLGRQFSPFELKLIISEILINFDMGIIGDPDSHAAALNNDVVESDSCKPQHLFTTGGLLFDGIVSTERQLQAIFTVR